MSGEEFDFAETRKRFPEHWDERGWPALKSTWRARHYPQMRVRVVASERVHDEVRASVFWNGSLEELRGLFRALEHP